jgi:hypothetical protein
VRTTVDLDADTAKAIERLRRERGIGLSEAVNELVRRGVLHRPESAAVSVPTRPLGLRVDVSNVAEALDVLEGDVRR